MRWALNKKLKVVTYMNALYIMKVVESGMSSLLVQMFTFVCCS